MTAPLPHLAPGDTGEWVLRLQTRLHALGLLDATLDGSFGETTEAAVRQLQDTSGLSGSGVVDDETWAALGDAEQRAGLQNPFADSPQVFGSTVVDPSTPPVGALSEDQQWRWDGEQWLANSAEPDGPAAGPHADEQGAGHLSSDGHWIWDGAQWQPVNK
jgi:hypothetical protein